MLLQSTVLERFGNLTVEVMRRIGVEAKALVLRLFGRAAFRVELHLKVESKDLHRGAFGPLQAFVKKLRAAICEALDIPLRRLQPLDVRGAWFTLSLAAVEDDDPDESQSLQPESSSDSPSQDNSTVASGTIVDFELLAS